MKKNNANHVHIMDRKIRWIFGFSVLALVIFLAILFRQNESSYRNSMYIVVLGGIFAFFLVLVILYRLSKDVNRQKKNEYQLNSILENTTTLIFIKDLYGRYIIVNRRFKTVFGLTDEMVINKTDYDFSPKERADHYKLIDEEVIATGKSFQVEEVVETSGGRRNLLLVKFPLFDDKQQVFGISGIATDITERVQNQQQLVIALKEAEEARELQEQFLANMSHEIRTPLNGIQGMTSLLLETSLSNEQKEFANTINRSLNNLLNIVNNILDFSNIKAGKLTLQKTAVNIPAIIGEIKKQFDYQATKKGIVFIINIHETVPALVTGDPYRLKQVLVNLVDNAVKFTNSGTIEIGVGLQHVSGRELILLFTITDTGIGIPADKQETIFKSFAQATMDISQGYGGAGLGLAISKGLVQLQGGDISVKSSPGHGAAFSFYIPYSIKDDTVQAPKAFDPAEQLKGKHFLVVEDNPVNQRLVSFVLQKVGGITDIASNGKEAIELLQKKNDYDLIIMDVQMPVMGGYETTIYIRKTMHLNTPIIALTATALKEDQEKCMAVGMNDFILKPFDFNDLYRRLNRLLSPENVAPVVDPMPATTVAQEKLYDLTLLEELDDKKYVADMLAFFLDNGPPDMKTLLSLVDKQDWDAVSKMSHKIKGAVGMLQSKRLMELLGTIEYAAKENARPETIRELMKEASYLYTAMEKQLHEVLAQLKKELPVSE